MLYLQSSPPRTRWWSFGLLLAVLHGALACTVDDGDGMDAGGSPVGDGDGDSAGDGDAGDGDDGSGNPFMNSDASVADLDAGDGDGDEDAGEACAAVATETELDPLHLVFLFDVSGSMGKLDFPWHDPALKWEPVSSAVRDFMQSDESRGLLATMTFFPAAAEMGGQCEQVHYETPEVPLTALPSDAFGDALDTIGVNGEWRGRTPTLAALRGIEIQLSSLKQDHPGEYAVILVTDGYPEGCDGANDIADVSARTAQIAAETPVYVLGVNNPPLDGAPPVLADLDMIASAGGTGSAILIDTGDPTQTATDLRAAVDAIQAKSIPCAADIPPAPAGQIFDRRKVTVSYDQDGMRSVLSYDADCSGSDGWHYDDPEDPKRVVLCESTCTALQGRADTRLEFEFGCEVVVDFLE